MPSPSEYTKRSSSQVHTVTHAVTHSKKIDDTVYEVDCQMITIKDGDVDIGMYMSQKDVDMSQFLLRRCESLRRRD